MMRYKETSHIMESTIEMLCRFSETRKNTPRLMYRKVESMGIDPKCVNLTMLASSDSNELKEFGIENFSTEDRTRRYAKTGNCVLNEFSGVDNHSYKEIIEEQKPFYENVPQNFFYVAKPRPDLKK